MNQMEIHKYSSPEQSIDALAELLIEKFAAAIREEEECTVVLSGGNSPRKLYEKLASANFAGRVEWSKLYFFFGDERYVPDDSDEYNGKMAKECLFDPLGIDPSQVYYYNTGLPPEECARDYARKIKAHFGNRPIRFNIMLLGLGDDAHTASLFPHTSILKEEKALVSAVKVDKLNSWRISLTAPLINEAEWIAFLVFGESKKNAMEEVIRGEKNPEEFPAQLIAPEEGELHWFIDEAAGAKLN